mgnify:CR=1 FL=1
MVEMRNGKKVLITPVSTEDLKDIKVGDIVYLDGSMTTCRDVAHRRLVEGGRELPVDVRDDAIFHAGPIIRPLENDKFEMVSVGPTTSMRMEKFEYEFVKQTGVKVIIGKGGMKENTERACKECDPLCISGRKRRCCGNGSGRDRACGMERSGNAGDTLELPCERIRTTHCIH